MDVPVSEAGIDTIQFLEATEGLIKMFGKFTSGLYHSLLNLNEKKKGKHEVERNKVSY